MNHKIVLLIILISYPVFAQNSGDLQGKITNELGEGITGANINIQGTGIGTESEENG